MGSGNLNRLVLKNEVLQHIKQFCVEHNIQYQTIDINISQRTWLDANTIDVKIDNRHTSFMFSTVELEHIENIGILNSVIFNHIQPMLEEIKEEQLILKLAGIE